MADLTFEDAKFIDMLVNVFTRQLDGIEAMVNGIDLSDVRMQALAMRKKVRAVQPPQPNVKPEEKSNAAEAKADATGAGKEPAAQAASAA